MSLFSRVTSAMVLLFHVVAACGQEANFGLAAGTWEVRVKEDFMTGGNWAFAVSPAVKNSGPLGGSEHGPNNWIIFGCDSRHEWIYFIWNSTSPNPRLVRADIKQGDARAGDRLEYMRVKWGDDLEKIAFVHTENLGEHFVDDEKAITKITEKSSLLIERTIHASLYYEFPLLGADKAVAEARKECRGADKEMMGDGHE